MKQKLFAMLFCLGAICGVQAQVKINSDFYPGISVRFKRCIVTGNVGYMDFTLTNNANGDINGRVTSIVNKGMDISFYDDEGNVYTHIPGNKSGARITNCTLGDGAYCCFGEGFSFSFPKGTTIKGRVEFAGTDEYATIFQLIKIAFRGMNSTPYGEATLEFRDVPITRE